MARTLRLFLVRHGETVDNVAQVYAGSLDSELTNHGFQQATRLGAHFAAVGLTFTHIFASPLQRASKTAGKIREAQLTRTSTDTPEARVPDVVHVPLLMEQDFGSMEGKKWYDQPPEQKSSGVVSGGRGSKESMDFVDIESKDSLARRADSFLDEHLLSLLPENAELPDLVIGIVSHGIFLSTLWKRLLKRLEPKSVTLSPELQATARPSLEHLGGWSNTGYLELHMTKTSPEEPQPTAGPVPADSSTLLAKTQVTNKPIGKVEVPQDASSRSDDALQTSPDAQTPVHQGAQDLSRPRIGRGWSTTILTINGKDHLKGLKRTGGGVGSSRHDASQKSIETFFKRRKID
ncbi:phosphoglycerate mutase-like protein [Pyrenochaeta sp. DS3sAY3a]|nr:phosphoglycerate mutase-like protein [Pyrenochaeta sp. DS3sAY3a]